MVQNVAYCCEGAEYSGKQHASSIFQWTLALTGVAQWMDHRPANRKVTSSIPSQGTCLGGGPGPQLGTCKRQLIIVSLAHRCSLPLFLPPFPSL